MAYNGNIQKPVGVPADVPRALGTTKTDWGELCTHPNINKWAWYKPVIVPNKIGVITETERKTAKASDGTTVAPYGLLPQTNSYVLSMLRSDISHSDYASEFTTAKNNMMEWLYFKPSGTLTSPFRLTDFVESPNAGEGRGSNGATTNFGYQPNTPPPLSFGSEWIIGQNDLANVANNIVVVTSTSSGAWTATPYTNSGTGTIGSGSAAQGTYCYEGLQYQDYRARFGSASNQNINLSNSAVIPLNFLLSSNMLTENWRLGIVVKVLGISGNNVIPSTTVGVFFSQAPLSSIYQDVASNVLKFSVDMCTNQVLAQKMLAYVQAKGTTQFECLPVVGKTNVSTIQGGGTNARTYQAINAGNAVFYSLPTGDKDFTITVESGETPAPSGNAQKTVGNWTIKSVWRGIYTGNASTPSSQRYPINNIIIYWSGSGTPTSSTTYNFNVNYLWQMYSGTVSTGYYNSSNVGYSGNATVSINGTTYYGRILQGGPNLVMPDQNQINLTVTT